MKLNLLCALSTVSIVESFTPHLPKYNTFKKPFSSTQQYYYKNDQPFDERIEIVRNNYETLKNEFIKQIKDPDIQRAEKIVRKSFKAAEQNAESFLSNQLEASPEAARILDEIKGMKVAESLSEAAATSATSLSNAISALKFSSEGLSDSIKSAEKVLESISSSVASGSTEGIDTDTLSMLKSSATEIKNSLQSVESIAKTITKVSESDEASLSKLGSVGESLIKSLKKLNNNNGSSLATTVGVAKIEPGTPTIIDQDSAAQSAISSLDTVAQDVIKEMEASEEIAKVVTKAAEADAAIAASSLESKANDVIENIMAVEKVVKEVSSGSIKNEVEAVAALKEITVNAVSKVQEDENTVEAVVNAIAKDASTDALAVNKLKELDDSVTEMIKAAEVVVKNLEKVDADTITALKAQATSVAECAECAIKEIENAQLTVEGSQEVIAAAGAVAVKDAKPIETVQTDTLEKNVASTTGIKSDTSTSSSSSSSSDDVVVSKVNEPVTSKAPEEISKTTDDSVAKTDNEHTNNVLVENSGKSDKVQDDTNLSAMNTKSSDSTTEANLHNKAEVSKTIEKSTVVSEDNVDSDSVNKNVVVKSDVTKDDSTLVVEKTDDTIVKEEASKTAKPEKSVDISSDADNTVDKTKLATTNSDKAVVQEKLETPKGEESIEKVVASNNDSMNDRNTVDDTIRNEISKPAETDKSPVEVTVASDNTKVVVDENNLIAKQKTSEESSVVQEKLQSDQVKESVESVVKRKDVLKDDNHLVAQKSNVEATTTTTISGDEKVILESKSLTENTVDVAKGDAPIETITNNVLASDGKVVNSDSIINTERIPEPIQTVVQNMKVVDSADANTFEHDVVKDHFIDIHTQVAESAASLTKEILQATDSTVTHEAMDKVITSTADIIVDSTQTATTEVASIIANLFFL